MSGDFGGYFTVSVCCSVGSTVVAQRLICPRRCVAAPNKSLILFGKMVPLA